MVRYYNFVLVACFLTGLFPAFVGNATAQGNSTPECGWKYRWVWQRVYEDRYNGTTDKYEPKMVYKPVWEWAYGCDSKSEGRNPSGTNYSKSGLSEIQTSEIVGIWEGVFDKGRSASVLEIKDVKGTSFSGTLKLVSGAVAVTGTINIKERGINFSFNNADRTFVYNWGSFGNDGTSISGSGMNNTGGYQWSFTKKSSADNKNETPSAKAPLSLSERLPLNLGEFKRVKLDKFDFAAFTEGSEECWEADYQIDKNSKVTVSVYRFRDSTEAIKRVESSIRELKGSDLVKYPISNRDNQSIGELTASSGDVGIAYLRNGNYFYRIVSKNKASVELLLKYLLLE